MASFWQKLGSTLSSAAGPIISGAFGIGSSLLGSKSQSDANKTNMQIAQMNNEWSEKMMEKQNAYNVAQWQREADFSKQQTQAANDFTEYMQDKANQYNSALEQAKRLREAGLNPALVMSGQNAGTATGASGQVGSTPSGNSVGLPSPTRADVRPISYEGFSNAINNAIQISMAKQKNDAEVNNLNSMADYNRAMAAAQVPKLYEETRGQKWQNDYNQRNQDVMEFSLGEDYMMKVQQRVNAEQTQKLIEQQRIAQELVNKQLPDKLAMEVAVMASTRDLNRQNVKTEFGKLIDDLKKRGYKLSKSEEDAIFKAVIQDVETQQYRGLGIANTLVGLLNRN